jgi:hypothetical protein
LKGQFVMRNAPRRALLAALTSVVAVSGAVPVALMSLPSAAAAPATSVSGSYGPFRFADAKSGKDRVMCDFNGGRLTGVSMAAPEVKASVSVKQHGYSTQYVSWGAKLQERHGAGWTTVGSRGDKHMVASVGRWSKLPAQPAFSTSQISQGHGIYRVVEHISWHSVTDYKVIQGTATRTMLNYGYPVTTLNAGFCRNANPTATLVGTVDTYPGDTTAHPAAGDVDGNAVTITIVSCTINGSTVVGFASVSGSNLVFAPTEADFGKTATVSYRVGDSLGAESSVQAINVVVQAPPGSSAPSAPGISVGHPSATQVSFAWGAGTPHGCSITGYSYQVNGGGWAGTSANTGVTLGSGYSQGYSVVLRVTDACGHSSTSSGSGSTDNPPPPPPPPPPAKAISIGWGSVSAPAGKWMNITFENFPTGTVTWYCVEEGHAYGPYSTTLSSSTQTLTANTCYDTQAGGSDYVTAGGVNSNTIGTD